MVAASARSCSWDYEAVEVRCPTAYPTVRDQLEMEMDPRHVCRADRTRQTGTVHHEKNEK